MGYNKSSSKREVYSTTILPQGTTYPYTKSKLVKEEQTQPKVSRRKENIKIRGEINEIEIKKTIAKLNETKSWFFEKKNNLIKLYPDSSRKKLVLY